MARMIFLLYLFVYLCFSQELSSARKIDLGNRDICGSPLSPSLSFSGLKIQAEFFSANSTRYYRTRISSCVNGEKRNDDILSAPTVLENLDFKSSMDYLSWATPICTLRLCYMLARRQNYLSQSVSKKVDDYFLGGIYQCVGGGSTSCDEFKPFSPLLRSSNRKPWTEMHREKLIAVLPIAEGPILRKGNWPENWYDFVDHQENYNVLSME